MSRKNTIANPHLEIVLATQEQMPILANLLELYMYEFSELVALAMGEDGRFGYPPLPLYWSEPDRHPFLLRVDGQWAGMVLVKREGDEPPSEGRWDVAEFFVLRGRRRAGIGTLAAHAIWRRFPGRWQVRVMQANVAGLRFWTAAIASFAGDVVEPAVIEMGGLLWSLFSFESEESGRV